MKVRANGREYTVQSMANLSLMPNVSKYSKAIYYIEGKLGAFYSLHERVNGTYWMMAAFGHRTIEVKSFEVVA